MAVMMVKIGAVAAMLGTTPQELRKWAATVERLAARKTRGGTPYYAVDDLLKRGDVDAPSVCYQPHFWKSRHIR